MKLFYRISCIFLLLGTYFQSHGQSVQSAIVSFEPRYRSEKVELEHYYPLSSTDSLEIETLKFYISAIEFRKSGKQVWKEENSYHLLDLSKPETFRIACNFPSAIEFDWIHFNIGIDSLTNVSGAMGGDLDPTKGMYWTWQSGYINLKLEGKTSRIQAGGFIFHLGGYQGKEYAMQQLELPMETSANVQIGIDMEIFFKLVDWSGSVNMMSPGERAVKLSEQFSQVFFVMQ